MNKQHDIDKLFANKLQSAGVKPSANAWEQLEADLASQKSNRSAIWLKVAAAIIILLVATVSVRFLITEQPNGLDFASVSEEMRQAPYPKPGQTDIADLGQILTIADTYKRQSEIMQKNTEVMQPSTQRNHLSSNRKMIQTLALQEHKENQEEQEIVKTSGLSNTSEAVAVQHTSSPVNTEVLETLKIKAPDLEAETVIASVETPIELPKVTITYKGQPEQIETTKNKFSFKKVFDSAKKLANGELIADLREAKDDLIQTAFKTSGD